MFIYHIGVEFSSKSDKIVFNAVALVSFIQIRLKKPFLQLNIFATVGEFIRPKSSTISPFIILYHHLSPFIIIYVLHKPDDCILLHLLYSNCVPIMTYASAVKTFSSREMQDCNTALNNAIRRIFSYNRWESIRTLRETFGYKSLTEIFHVSSTRFIKSLTNHPNRLIRDVYD